MQWASGTEISRNRGSAWFHATTRSIFLLVRRRHTLIGIITSHRLFLDSRRRRRHSRPSRSRVGSRNSKTFLFCIILLMLLQLRVHHPHQLPLSRHIQAHALRQQTLLLRSILRSLQLVLGFQSGVGSMEKQNKHTQNNNISRTKQQPAEKRRERKTGKTPPRRIKSSKK